MTRPVCGQIVFRRRRSTLIVCNEREFNQRGGFRATTISSWLDRSHIGPRAERQNGFNTNLHCRPPLSLWRTSMDILSLREMVPRASLELPHEYRPTTCYLYINQKPTELQIHSYPVNCSPLGADKINEFSPACSLPFGRQNPICRCSADVQLF